MGEMMKNQASEQAHRADLQTKSGMGTAEVSGGVSSDSSLFAEVAREIDLLGPMYGHPPSFREENISRVLTRRFGPLVEAGRLVDKTAVDFLSTSIWVRPECFEWPDCPESEKITEVRRRQETRFVLHGAWIAAMKSLRQTLTNLEKKG